MFKNCTSRAKLKEIHLELMLIQDKLSSWASLIPSHFILGLVYIVICAKICHNHFNANVIIWCKQKYLLSNVHNCGLVKKSYRKKVDCFLY